MTAAPKFVVGVFVVSVLLFSAPLITLMAADENVSVRVVDANGSGLPAYVILHQDTSAGRPNTLPGVVVKLLDLEGWVAWRVDPGPYDLCVMIGGFQPECSKVRVKEGAVTAHTFTMRVDKNMFD